MRTSQGMQLMHEKIKPPWDKCTPACVNDMRQVKGIKAEHLIPKLVMEKTSTRTWRTMQTINKISTNKDQAVLREFEASIMESKPQVNQLMHRQDMTSP